MTKDDAKRVNENLVTRVIEGGIADDLGIAPGDRLISINRQRIIDSLDLHYLDQGEELLVEIDTAAGERIVFEIEREEDESLGLELAPIEPRACRNRCLFCFAMQNPPGVRSSLRFKDEDYRLSFLRGLYVTLSHLAPEDEARIIARRLSPLFVSVHATDESVRRHLLGREDIRPLLPLLKNLTAAGIQIHTQVVLVPSINDGRTLDRTIADLAALHPGILDLAIVPVGLTRHRQGLFPITPPTGTWAAEIIETVTGSQRELLGRLGARFAFLADEFYLLADQPRPDDHEYEGYPQLGDGVGSLTHFEREFDELWSEFDPRLPGPVNALVITGRAAEEVIRRAAGRLMERAEGLTLEVVSVPNRFFGESVTVAGLVSGGDIAERLALIEGDQPVIVPSVMLQETDDLFLDGLTIDDLSRLVRRRVRVSDPDPFSLWSVIRLIAQS